MDEAQVEQPIKKARGWPKGKPRGPRKPKVVPAPEPAPTPAPAAPVPPPAPAPDRDPETEVELCAVRVVTNAGQAYSFPCSAFSANAQGYEFVSFPKRRGYKVLHILRGDQFALLGIEAPEQFFQSLARPAPVAYSGTPTLHAVPMETGTPMVSVNPIAQRIKDEKANVSRTAEDKYGRPAAEVVDDKGNRSVVNAAMVRM